MMRSFFLGISAILAMGCKVPPSRTPPMDPTFVRMLEQDLKLHVNQAQLQTYEHAARLSGQNYHWMGVFDFGGREPLKSARWHPTDEQMHLPYAQGGQYTFSFVRTDHTFYTLTRVKTKNRWYLEVNAHQDPP